MAESLFNIFGDHTRQALKNVSRQPLSDIENMGNKVSAGPYKPNEPTKKGGEPKKSFLSNTGKALKMTPGRNVFTPRAMNMGSVIYTDENTRAGRGITFEEIEFTKPSKKLDYRSELFDFLLPEYKIAEQVSPPSTPPPKTKTLSMEFDSSYDDDFFKDYFSNQSALDSDLPYLQDDLPALY